MSAVSSSSNFNYGYPTPGPQTPTSQQVMDHVFFVSNTEWKRVREEEQFDYIVIGSGCCALGFVEKALRNNPKAKILIIERGPFFLPEHFQSLPLPYQQVIGGLSETFPWTLSAKTHQGRFIKWQHGMVPFFGGRSIMWSTWCPRPTREEMEGWPETVIDAASKYFKEAEELLNVIPADKIYISPERKAQPDSDLHSDLLKNTPYSKQRPVFGVLQQKLTTRIEKHLKKIDSAKRAFPAPLAVGVSQLLGIDFDKFSTPSPLLELVDKQHQLAQRSEGEPLRIVTECVVTRILEQEGKPTALETTRGVVNIGDAKLILAMGTLPPTTLVLNSFPQVNKAGQRFTAHFISAIVARVCRKDFDFHHELADLELAAIYIAGIDEKTQGQYHIQLTALSDKNPDENARKAGHYMPDVVATASPEQLCTSKDHIVFVCAVLGELDHKNKDNWFHKQDGSDLTSNVMLQVLQNDNDSAVWDTMDEGTFQALERVLSPKGEQHVEYWHASADGSGEWRPNRPPTEQIRVPGLVHEGSTMWIGDDDQAVVGLDYQLKGVENVYVTGASIWPKSGSWNPTLTMVGLAQHLADILTKPIP
jgi:choline dehydrogenase-like flavoprotein